MVAPCMREYVCRTVGKTVPPRTSVPLSYLSCICGWNFQLRNDYDIQVHTDTFTIITGFVAVLTFVIFTMKYWNKRLLTYWTGVLWMIGVRLSRCYETPHRPHRPHRRQIQVLGIGKARCYCGGKYRRSKTPTRTKVAVIYRHDTNASSLLLRR